LNVWGLLGLLTAPESLPRGMFAYSLIYHLLEPDV
jgi:hypothetical protein